MIGVFATAEPPFRRRLSRATFGGYHYWLEGEAAGGCPLGFCGAGLLVALLLPPTDGSGCSMFLVDGYSWAVLWPCGFCPTGVV